MGHFCKSLKKENVMEKNTKVIHRPCGFCGIGNFVGDGYKNMSCPHAIPIFAQIAEK